MQDEGFALNHWSGQGRRLLLLLAVLGCAVPTSDFELFGGFHLDWESLSHRVSLLEVGIGEEGPEMGLVGGDWSTGESFSDWIHYRLASLEIRNAKARLGQGRIPLVIAPRELDDDGQFRNQGIAEGELVLPISEVGSWSTYTALIQGFGVNTAVEQGPGFPDDYDSAHGYALGALGVDLGEVRREDEEVRVSVSLRFEPSSTEEGILDRPAMNASIPQARFEGWVEVAIVGHERKGTTLPLEAVGEHSYEPPYSVQEATLLDVDFGKGRIAGWSALSFEVNPGGSGDYIRSIGAEVLGEEDLEAVGFDLTNSSAFELAPFSYVVSGTLALLDVGRGSSIALRARSGEADVGNWIP